MSRVSFRLPLLWALLLSLCACEILTRRDTPEDPKPKPSDSDPNHPASRAMSLILSGVEVSKTDPELGDVVGVTVTVKDTEGKAYTSLDGLTCTVLYAGGTSFGHLSPVTAGAGVFLAGLTTTNAGTASKVVASLNGTPLALKTANVQVHWYPTTAPGLKVWLKADALSGVTTGDGIGTWHDSSGQSNDAVQALVANQPTYIANAINNKPALFFNGSSEYLTVTNNSGLESTAVTVFAVVKYNARAANSAIIVKATNASWNDGWGLADVSGTGAGIGTFVNDKTAHRVAGALGTGSYVYLTGTYDRTSLRGLQNLIPIGSNAYTTNVNNPSVDIHIGNSPGSVGYFSGEIAEILVYDNGLPAVHLQNALLYLQSKYGL